MFQIIQGSPTYCQITDGIIGSHYRRLPMVYCREDYARKLAGEMGRKNYEECGDDWFYVVRAGEPALNRLGRENRVNAVVAYGDNFDEIPF